MTPERLGVAWFSLLFMLAVGIKNGASNQNKYLLAGLRFADPDFLPGDWFTWEVLHPQHAFSLLVAAMAYSGQLNLALASGAALQSAIFAVASYAVVRVLYEKPLIPWAASLAVFASMRTISVGTVYWILPFLEASTIAGVALVVGLALLGRDRPLAAGVSLGISALFHGHFFVLSLPVLFAVSMVMLMERERQSAWKRVGLMWVVFLLLAAPTLFTIMKFARAPGADDIRWVNAALFPYHVAPWTWSRDPAIVLVAAMLFGAGGVLLRAPMPNKKISAAMGFIALSVFSSLFLAYFRVLDFAVEAWPWRLSPVVLFAGLLTGMASLASSGSWPLASGGRARLGLGLLLSALVVIATLSPSRVSYVLLVVSALPVAQWIASSLSGHPRTARLRWGWIVGLWITVAFWPSVTQGLQRSHVEFRPLRAERQALYEWIRSETPESAVFAIPPSWERFRLNARRSVVVDWKAIPRYPPHRIEWLERMRALTGVQEIGANPADLDLGFYGLDCDRVEILRARFDVQFVILERAHGLECAQVVHEAGGYRIWKLEGPGANPDL